MMINKKSAMLTDVQYVRGTKESNYNDYIYIIWRDLDTGEKHLNISENPKIPIYIEKEAYRAEHFNKRLNMYYNVPYKELDKTEMKLVEYKNVIGEIAHEAGPKAYEAYKQMKFNDYRRLGEFHLWPFVFGSDIDIRTVYYTNWKQKYDNNRTKVLRKGFLDIECDIMESGTPDPSCCPIDLVTVIDAYNKKSYTFSLLGVQYTPRNLEELTPARRAKEIRKKKLYDLREEQQSKICNDVDGLISEIHEKFDENYPGMEYKLYFYKDEKKMLIQLFQLINTLKLDMIGIWNMRFDIPFIIDRLKALGCDPKEYMTHPDFPVKECYFKEDKRNFTIKNQTDSFKLSSYTTFVCQMRNYASIRKGGSEFRSYKLTYIAQKEIGDEKYDYSEQAGSITTLSYLDYKSYILYNIKDVLLQVGIEERTDDFDALYIASYDSNCPYEYVYKQTMKLRSLQYYDFLENQKLIIGNNINQYFSRGRDSNSLDDDNDDKDDGVKFEGAVVGQPLLNTKFGAKIYGKKSSSVFLYAIDMDMSSFYPSLINAMNIDPLALIFKMILSAELFNVRGGKYKYKGITSVQLFKENKDTFSDDVSAEAMDNLQTRNYMSTGEKWLNLPGVDKIYKLCKKKCT